MHRGKLKRERGGKGRPYVSPNLSLPFVKAAPRCRPMRPPGAWVAGGGWCPRSWISVIFSGKGHTPCDRSYAWDETEVEQTCPTRHLSTAALGPRTATFGPFYILFSTVKPYSSRCLILPIVFGRQPQGFRLRYILPGIRGCWEGLGFGPESRVVA